MLRVARASAANVAVFIIRNLNVGVRKLVD